jgi:hypothetical protein
VNWDTTKKTTGFTAVSGVGYFCDTTSSAFTVTLPSSPSAGAIVGIADYAGTSATNNITIGRNGSNIEGLAVNGSIYVNRDSTTLIYVDATQGWVPIADNVGSTIFPGYVAATGGTVLTCGDYKTHVFTGPGTFTVTCAGNAAGANTVEYLVVAGGGGGQRAAGGGGGAGGYRQNYPSPTLAGLPVTAIGYPITVGGGGSAGSPGGPSCGVTKGGNSIFSTITSAGGGTGVCGGGGAPGGSGGGNSNFDTNPANVGTGNTPPVSPPQGNPGGIAAAFSPSPSGGTAGGGGGAGASGTNAPNPLQSGPGGIGSPIAIAFFGPTSPSYGTPGPAPGRYFAGGGGGGTYIAASPGSGGEGGGGAGTKGGPGVGTTNTGGGGGGGNHPGGAENAGGAGGSGIVVIRYRFQ